MDLNALARRFDHDRDGEHADKEVFLMDSEGCTASVLSLNWDEEGGRWLLIADHYGWQEPS